MPRSAIFSLMVASGEWRGLDSVFAQIGDLPAFSRHSRAQISLITSNSTTEPPGISLWGSKLAPSAATFFWTATHFTLARASTRTFLWPTLLEVQRSSHPLSEQP